MDLKFKPQVELLLDVLPPVLVKVVLVYLISHNRPINELLAPSELDIKGAYEQELVGMTNLTISLEDLIQTRLKLVKTLNDNLSQAEKEFLLSVKDGSPDWDKLEFPNIHRLPAVQWKLLNIRKMNPKKRLAAYEKLKQVLNI